MYKTEVKIRRLFEDENSAMKALVSLTVDTDLGKLAIHDMKLIQPIQGRSFVAMPSLPYKKGAYRDIIHPTDETVRRNLEEAVFDAYEEATGIDLRSLP